MSVRPERINILRADADTVRPGAVVYWMGRERRLHDNWALLHAQELAASRGSYVHVVFCLVPTFLQATIRQYGFMLRGMEELEKDLRTYGIPLTVLPGTPADVLPAWLHQHPASVLVTDFEPLKIKRQWLRQVQHATSMPLHVVDAHNIVPCWHVSPKQETGAYTLRPRINRLLPTFLEEFPAVQPQPWPDAKHMPVDWHALRASLNVNISVTEVSWLDPGEQAGRRTLDTFTRTLGGYAEKRNNPTAQAQSNLSPYFHFGQLAPQRAALEASANRTAATGADVDSFLEELIVRRELADNYTFYNASYDTFEGFPAWARQSLNEHRPDRRDYVYPLEQWEARTTHDPLWNAAQHEMSTTGKMHGYMRMYWAKKILEWSASPDEAMAIAIHLNDTYELDGRDPNGYAGIAWSIGGVHDRAWFERPVYGKIRYMNANGCARKFDVKAYIAMNSDTGLFA